MDFKLQFFLKKELKKYKSAKVLQIEIDLTMD